MILFLTLGISIIAESFGNLEKALDSMRRAYEIQPANESLQNEVKRLMKQKMGLPLKMSDYRAVL